MIGAVNACTRLGMLWDISYSGLRSVLGRHGIYIDSYYLTSCWMPVLRFQLQLLIRLLFKQVQQSVW